MLYTHRIAACSAASQCRPLAQCSIVYQHFNPEVILLNRAANDPSVFTITEKAPTQIFSWYYLRFHI